MGVLVKAARVLSNEGINPQPYPMVPIISGVGEQASRSFQHPP